MSDREKILEIINNMRKDSAQIAKASKIMGKKIFIQLEMENTLPNL